MNTNPLFVATLSLVPASGVSTRIHEVCIGPVCQFILTWTRPNFFGSSLLTTTDAGVGVAPLSACDLTPPPPGRPPALILGYTRIAAVDMAPALRRLKAAWAF